MEGTFMDVYNKEVFNNYELHCFTNLNVSQLHTHKTFVAEVKNNSEF